MKTYRVIYEIDVEADTPEAAAREAYECMRDPESMPPMLDVVAWSGDCPPDFTSDLPNVQSFDLSVDR